MVLLLKLLDYHFLVKALSMELYMGLIAALFTGFGIYMGLKLTRRKTALAEVESSLAQEESLELGKISAFELDQEKITQLGISTREYEVLELIAKGNSNQEIADYLFISLNTVKTHSSNLFSKLDVKRRTQAVQQARALRILP